MLFNSMKNFYWKYLASNRLTAILFIIFPTSMALGTFIESWYSTDTAKIWIYNAWWFELIMVLFTVSFVTNIFKYKLLRKEKWSILLIHISLILILVVLSFCSPNFLSLEIMLLCNFFSKSFWDILLELLFLKLDSKKFPIFPPEHDCNKNNKIKKTKLEILFAILNSSFFLNFLL